MLTCNSSLKLNSTVDHVMNESLSDRSVILTEKEQGVKIAVAEMSDNGAREAGLL
jgi:hypothetical protein